MSYAHTIQVSDMAMPPGRKAVLTALAGFANAAGMCSPTIADIARHACVSVRAVHTNLKALEDAGLLVRKSKPGRETTYTIKIGGAL